MIDRLVRIRWPLIALPAFLVGAFEYFRHTFFAGLPDPVGNLAAALIAATGSLIYYTYTVWIIERLSASLHEQRARKAVTDERERIAAQLHDSVAQSLFFLNAQLDRVSSTLAAGNPQEAMAELEEAKKGVSFAHQDLRHAIAALRETRAEKPLNTGLQEITSRFYRQSGIDINLYLPDKIEPVANDVRAAVFRIVQESLNNVRKHARADRVEVRLACSAEALRVSVEDTGAGFDPGSIESGAKEGLGISAMKKAAAKVGGLLAIESREGEGTRVFVSIPCERAFVRAGSPTGLRAASEPARRESPGWEALR